MSTDYEKALAAAEYIRHAVTAAKQPLPSAALVLGSGLGGLTKELHHPLILPYADIPYFPTSGVVGHAGELAVGCLDGTWLYSFSGRVHAYEGHSMSTVTFYVRVLHLLGVRTLLLTNAAGGVNRDFVAGDLMLITDHIKWGTDSPVIGEADERFTPRFFDMSRAYSPRLQQLARTVAKQQDLLLREGVYVYMGGPQYETPAEIRAVRTLGGDAVGMSTVPEVIMAAGCGMEVGAVSCITNMAAGVVENTVLSHGEVTDMAARASRRFVKFIRAWVAEL